MEMILVIGMILFLVLTRIDFYFLMKNIKKERDEKENKREIDVQLATLLLGDNFVGKVNSLIDSLIQEQVEIYQVMILARDMSIHYIKAEEQDKMTKYIIYSVMKNISPELKQLISLIYDTKTDKDLENVIGIRTKLFLINFITNYNKEFDDEDIKL